MCKGTRAAWLGVLFVLGWVCVGCQSSASNGGIALCAETLKPELKTRVRSISLEEFSSQLRERMSQSSDWSESIKTAGSLGFVYKGFPINANASREKVRLLQQKFESNNEYVAELSDFSDIMIDRTEDAAFRSFVECVKNNWGLAVTADARASDLIEFTIQWVQPPGRYVKPPVFKGIVISDGSSAHPTPLLVVGKQLPEEMTKVAVTRQSGRGTLFQIHTSAGSASSFVPWNGPNGYEPPSRIHDHGAFKAAHDAWSARMEDAKKIEWRDFLGSPMAGLGRFAVDPLAFGDRIIRINGRPGRCCDNFFFTVRRADGSTSDTRGLNDHNGGGSPQDFVLRDDEYITGYRLRYGNKTDSVRFITNQGRELLIGGGGGDKWLPRDGSFVTGWSNRTELVALSSKSGQTVDDLSGGFRRVLSTDEAREPKLTDFPVSSSTSEPK